jgi:IclR family acetate operon transcriptional repressor
MQLVVRTLAVVRHLADHPEGQSLVELANAIGAPLSTLHRLMAVLVTEEFALRSLKDKRYTLGPGAVSLNRGMRRVEEIARPHMAELSARTQETVFLTEMVGLRAVCTALVDGSRPLRLSVRVGQELPIHAAASARAILAFLPEDEVNQLLDAHDFVRFTEKTPHTVAAVKKHLCEVAHRGFDMCDQELDLNVVAISAPVRSQIGAVTASVTLAAPRDRISALVRRRWTAQVIGAARAISTESGYFSANPEALVPSPTQTRS